MVVRVRVFHQTDLGGTITGGIDSFIRGIARWAPQDISYSVVGLTMDPVARPVGRWSRLEVAGRSVDYFAVGECGKPMQRHTLPLSVRLALGAFRFRRGLGMDCDVFEAHRIEPALVLKGLRKPMIGFMHQNMKVLYEENSDIAWKWAPGLYFALERRALPKFASIFCVRSDAVQAYKQRYPDMAERFSFIPTWYEPDVFHPAKRSELVALRSELRKRFAFPVDSRILVSVGRLNRVKNPLLLIEAFRLLLEQHTDARLLMVGDGPMRAEVERSIEEAGLSSAAAVAGIMEPESVARVLRGADLYVMSSRTEGMPISVLEALGTGLPVVSTDVGEIQRVVRRGINGELVQSHEPAALAAAFGRVLSGNPEAQRAASLQQVGPYVPQRVLAPVFDAYRAAAAVRSI